MICGGTKTSLKRSEHSGRDLKLSERKKEKKNKKNEEGAVRGNRKQGSQTRTSLIREG